MNHPARLLLALLLILCIPLAACAEAVESPRASASAPANPAGTAQGRSPERQTRRRVPGLPGQIAAARLYAPVSFRLWDAPRRYPSGAKQR